MSWAYEDENTTKYNQLKHEYQESVEKIKELIKERDEIFEMLLNHGTDVPDYPNMKKRFFALDKRMGDLDDALIPEAQDYSKLAAEELDKHTSHMYELGYIKNKYLNIWVPPSKEDTQKDS